MTERRWTLDAARELLGEIYARTERAVQEAESLLAEREAAATASESERAEVERGIQQVVGRWAREMEALGVEVKGPWLVDFDTGSGYYCWKWPERSLEYFHTYEAGFAGRTRIQ
jgi:hypothetical protein